MHRVLALGLFLCGACTALHHGHGDMGGTTDGPNNPPPPNTDGGGIPKCNATEFSGCYTVYAHTDHVLFKVDLMAKKLVQIGPFNAPMVGTSEDVITDLAVTPDDKVYVISKSSLYTADSVDGHVTLIGPVTACGSYAVALTFTPDGSLYAADFKGAFCKIDVSTSPPTVTQLGTLGSNLAIAGDLVAVADGTVFGTAYNLSDPSNMGTQIDNLLVKINPANGMATPVPGMTGFAKLFGVAFEMGRVFGFTHDGTGQVVTIDPTTGVGTLYATFMDPATGMPLKFAGAGVNSMVSPTIQ